MLVREQPVAPAEELEREIQVKPTSQRSGIEVAASQVTVFRLRHGEYIGLVFGLKNQELPSVVLQQLHPPFLPLLGVFGNFHGPVPTACLG